MEEKPMNRITSLVAKSLIIILMSSGSLAIDLQAQSDLPMTVSIPFAFTIGTQRIAPGTYQFSLVSGQFLLSVRNVKTVREEMYRVRPEHQRALESPGRLLFRKSEGSNVLSEVHFPDTTTFSEVIQLHDHRRVEAKRATSNISMLVGQR
jgi:hypothetical protein